MLKSRILRIEKVTKFAESTATRELLYIASALDDDVKNQLWFVSDREWSHQDDLMYTYASI